MMRILTVCLATAMAATTLLAQGRPGRGDGSRTPNLDAVTEALNLNDSQLAAIQQNNRALREQVRAIMQEAHDKRQALDTELESENPNPTIIGQMMLDARASHEKAGELKSATREQNVGVLDAQQQAALTALQEADRSPALRQAGMLNLIEGGPGRGGPGGPGMKGRGHGPRGGRDGGGPRG